MDTLLNTLTKDNLAVISSEIAALLDRVEGCKASSTLKKTAAMIVVRALDNEPHWSAAYASLVRELTADITATVPTDRSGLHAACKLMRGGLLFHGQLIQVLRDELEILCVTAPIHDEDKSRESWNPATASQRRIGIARFTGHLFFERQLSDSVIHEFTETLQGCTEELECLFALLSVAGELLRTQKPTNHYAEQCFLRMATLLGESHSQVNPSVVLEVQVTGFMRTGHKKLTY